MNTPEQTGRYRIVQLIGRGAMGTVYEGIDPQSQQPVAIKTVRTDGLAPAQVAALEQRFTSEVRAAAGLRHPHIVAVLDAGRGEGLVYLVMERVQGRDLRQLLQRGRRFTLQQCLTLMQELLAALSHAHLQGVLHRDVKPANVLIDDSGRAKLGDFGLARLQAGDGAATGAAAGAGTPRYMAPEQARGELIDERADLFAAGVLLYQLVTGRLPFTGGGPAELMQQLQHQAHRPALEANPALPGELGAVLDRALAKDRAQRFADAAEFSHALQQVADRCDAETLRSLVPEAVPDEDEDRTLPGPLAAVGAGPVAGDDDERTVVMPAQRDEATVIMPARAAPPTAPVPVVAAVPAAAPPQPPAQIAPTPSAPPPSASAPPPDLSAPPAGRSRAPLVIGVALVALLGLGVAAWWWRSAPEPVVVADLPPAASAPPAPAFASAAGALSDETAPSTMPAPLPPTEVQPAASAPPLPASGPAVAAPAAENPPAPVPKPAAKPPVKKPAPPPAAPRPEPSPSPAPVQAPAPAAPPPPAPVAEKRPASPSEACADRSFVARAFCVHQQCKKPGFHAHAECVKLREEEEARQRASP